MIKNAIVYFILDKCLDRLETQIEYNLTAPEKRKLNPIHKFIEQWMNISISPTTFAQRSKKANKMLDDGYVAVMSVNVIPDRYYNSAPDQYTGNSKSSITG